MFILLIIYPYIQIDVSCLPGLASSTLALTICLLLIYPTVTAVRPTLWHHMVRRLVCLLQAGVRPRTCPSRRPLTTYKVLTSPDRLNTKKATGHNCVYTEADDYQYICVCTINDGSSCHCRNTFKPSKEVSEILTFSRTEATNPRRFPYYRMHLILCRIQR